MDRSDDTRRDAQGEVMTGPGRGPAPGPDVGNAEMSPSSRTTFGTESQGHHFLLAGRSVRRTRLAPGSCISWAVRLVASKTKTAWRPSSATSLHHGEMT